MTINGRKLTASAILAIAIGQAAADAAPANKAQELCAAVLVAEAGGEGGFAMHAVWEVIHTRAINRKLSHADVVRQRWQFSCLNRVSAEALIKRGKRHRRWPQAMAIAGRRPQTKLTAGADHYHAASMAKRPYWARGATPTATVGGHLFYKLNK